MSRPGQASKQGMVRTGQGVSPPGPAALRGGVPLPGAQRAGEVVARFDDQPT